MAQINYSIKKNRLKKALMDGMELDEANNRLYLSPQEHRSIYLPAIDKAEDIGDWGRFFFDTHITEDMVVYIYAMSLSEETFYDEDGMYRVEDILLDEKIPDEHKKKLFHNAGGLRFVGKNDILLYGLTGRYLFLRLEVIGAGEGFLSHLRINVAGDNFMDTFPAIYQEKNGFFHRFLSVFSSIYNDFDHEIDRLPELLDIENCPEELLVIYGRWLGIDLSGDFLSEEAMRTFVREGYNLNRMKGTRACLERILEIVLDERVIILEQNTIQSYMEQGELFDTSMEHSSIYDVNILIKKPLGQTQRHQLLHLLRQFAPLRSRIHLIQLKDSGVLDTDVFMDLNAVLSEETYGSLDNDMEMDDDIVLE